jgi:hypothetical protein
VIALSVRLDPRIAVRFRVGAASEAQVVVQTLLVRDLCVGHRGLGSRILLVVGFDLLLGEQRLELFILRFLLAGTEVTANRDLGIDVTVLASGKSSCLCILFVGGCIFRLFRVSLSLTFLVAFLALTLSIISACSQF